MKLPFNFLLDFTYCIECPHSHVRLYIGDETCFFFLPFGLCQHGTLKTMPFIIIRFVRAPGHHSCLKNITKKRRRKHFVTIRSISLKKVGGGGRKRRKMNESWNDVGWLYLNKVQLNPMKWLESCMRQMNTYIFWPVSRFNLQFDMQFKVDYH
jgi:hypothetical protein